MLLALRASLRHREKCLTPNTPTSCCSPSSVSSRALASENFAHATFDFRIEPRAAEIEKMMTATTRRSAEPGRDAERGRSCR